MKPSEVLFVAGNVDRLASIRIRCREIAQRLGMRCYFNATNPREVPRGYKAYICVKPDFGWQGAEQLAKRGPVVWDILDVQSPTEGVAVYISSTRVAAEPFKPLGRIAVIPHYHCNIERIPSPGDFRTIGYIGSEHWYPVLKGIPHRVFFVSNWGRGEVASAYRSIGISVNLRNLSGNFDRFLKSNDIKPDTGLHIKVNSGMKLINCLGFGVPSVSAVEPAYKEIAPHCTIFSELKDCAAAIARLQEDEDLYREMRKLCLEMAPAFHVDEIVGKYRDLIESL